MITLNKIVKGLSDFASAHQQINGFFFQMLPDTEKDEVLIYPMLFAEITGSEVGENYDRYTFDFMVVNQPKVDDRTSNQEVLSDTKLMANDVIAYLKMQVQDYFLVSDFTLEPLFEVSDDSVSGWRWSLSITLNQGLDSCIIPATTTPENESSQVLILNQDGETIATLYAGMTYTVEQLQAVIDTITGNTTTIIDPID